MGPQDGVDYALRSLAALRDMRPDDWHAAFVGDGDVLRRDARARAAELGLDDHVDVHRADPGRRVARATSRPPTSALAPDPNNPLNDVSTMNKVLEYMAMALPIVSFDLREARVSAGDAARLRRLRTTSDEFATPHRGAARRPGAARARMGAVGRVRVEQDLSWEHSRRALLSAYETVLARGGALRSARARRSRLAWARNGLDS